ncbi:MAG: helix-turn-helix domain-containing protein [Steroidobacteraceae bacterium]
MLLPAPTPSLLSIEQVAQILTLNARTVRSYVRKGSLKATRIGKQYRIALDDLEAFTGRPVKSHVDRVLSPALRVEISSVISVEGVTPARAGQITDRLGAAADGLRSIAQSIAVSTSYDAPRDRLQVLLASDLKSTRDFLSMIEAALKPLRAE